MYHSYQVSGVEILSGGIIKLQASEAEVNDISIRFLDKTYVTRFFQYFCILSEDICYFMIS